MPSITTVDLQRELKARRDELIKKMEALEDELAMLDDAIELVSEAVTLLAVRTVTEPPVAAPNAIGVQYGDQLLAVHFVDSMSYPWTKNYDVEAWLVDGNIVYTCSCPAFIYTKGEVRKGEKGHCKHITQELRNALANDAYNARMDLLRA